ncbi:MAG: sugar phosphate isomerase/epimerase [Clostridiaceae bacterium]|jgi:L-ribulose-5-phosphate 3-epimerase|nr:sugar phosphate isomerase/epimerase [Clostridiaceae bacterium]
MILSTEIGDLRARIGERRSIELLASVGFDALDYTFYTFATGMGVDEMPWNRENYAGYAREVSKIAKDNGIYFNQAHAPFNFNFDCLPDFDKEIMPRQIRCMEYCAILGIPVIVVHPINHLPFPKNKEKVREINMEYCHRLQPYAKEFGVRIALENLYRYDNRRGVYAPDVFTDPADFAVFIDELNAPEFVCCIDTGHCSITGQDAADAINIMSSRVKALHINDNLCRTDDHLVPGMGLIDWDSVAKALADINYDGDFTLEALNPYRAFDESFFYTAAKYMHDVGRFLIRKFEQYARENKGNC